MKSDNLYQEREIKTKIIRIAILKSEPLFWTTASINFFNVILNNYTWKKNNSTYNMISKELSDKDILNGELNNINFDILLIPGGGVGDGHSITKGFNSSIKVKKWKKKIQNFVKEGGGCIGFCGGAALITPLSTGENRKPRTFVERQYNKSSLDISCFISYYRHLAFPLFYIFQYKHPEKIGTTAYVFSYEPGKTKDGKRIHTGGIPIDFIVDKNNPIFSDYPYSTIRIRWWGGQSLLIPKNQDRQYSILATYPNQELHENNETRIHAWRYIGGLRGLISAFLRALSYVKENKLKIFETAMTSFYLAGDWKLSNKIIETHFANKPAITTEIYPNKNQARITLITAHPQYMIWNGGNIIEKNDNEFNCLAKGLYKWENIEKFKGSIDDYITNTWWLVRRLVAWTAKVKDRDLPPIIQQKLTDSEMSILSSNIFWDGTLKNIIENI